MDFTILCPNCNTKLKLFDSQVKKKEGYIRCTRCGARIKYDLTKPQPAATGFWPDREVPFKPGAQRRFLSIAKAMQEEPGQQLPQMAPVPETSAPQIPPSFDRSQGRFQKFDLKAGQILPEGKGSAFPVSAAPPEKKAASFSQEAYFAEENHSAAPMKPLFSAGKASPAREPSFHIGRSSAPAAPAKTGRNISKTSRTVSKIPIRTALRSHPGILRKSPESLIGKIRYLFLRLFHGTSNM